MVEDVVDLSVAMVTLWNEIWGKVFRNGPSEICGRQPLKNSKWYGLLKH